MTVRLALYLALLIVWSVTAEVILKYALRREGHLSLEWTLPWRLAHNPWIWVATAFLGTGYLIWVVFLSRVDLGIAWGLSSLSYLVALLAARIFLNEPLTPLRWAGIILVTLGSILLVIEMDRPKEDASPPSSFSETPASAEP